MNTKKAKNWTARGLRVVITRGYAEKLERTGAAEITNSIQIVDGVQYIVVACNYTMMHRLVPLK